MNIWYSIRAQSQVTGTEVSFVSRQWQSNSL
jgi:hypothetical protein